MNWDEILSDTKEAMKNQEKEAEGIISLLRIIFYSLVLISNVIQTFVVHTPWQSEILPTAIALIFAIAIHWEIILLKTKRFKALYSKGYTYLVLSLDVLLISTILVISFITEAGQINILLSANDPLIFYTYFMLFFSALIQVIDIFRFNTFSSYYVSALILVTYFVSMGIMLSFHPEWNPTLMSGDFHIILLVFIMSVLLIGAMSVLISSRIRAVVFRSLKQDTLERFLPESIVREILMNKTEKSLESGKRTLSILFADLMGFTAFSENKSPEEVMQYLNLVLGKMIDQVFAHKGVLDKIIGDGIMAIFGTQGTPETSVMDAVQAGLSMKKTVDQWNSERRAEGLEALDISIGIHTGDVIIGTLGTRKRMDFTAIGDTVNTASRLESLTRTVGKSFLLSENTASLLDPQIPTREIGSYPLKGKKEKIKVFSVETN